MNVLCFADFNVQVSTRPAVASYQACPTNCIIDVDANGVEAV
jgi:hypothetical protein